MSPALSDISYKNGYHHSQALCTIRSILTSLRATESGAGLAIRAAVVHFRLHVVLIMRLFAHGWLIKFLIQREWENTFIIYFLAHSL